MFVSIAAVDAFHVLRKLATGRQIPISEATRQGYDDAVEELVAAGVMARGEFWLTIAENFDKLALVADTSVTQRR